MKQTIKIKESKLRHLIEESIKHCLTEEIEPQQNIDGYYIGFTNKFYTLWYVHQEPWVNYQGKIEGYMIKHEYIKNISFDENTAKEKYPEAKFDPELRGHSSSFITYHKSRQITDDDAFKFGKYKGEKFTDVSDSSYLRWYLEQSGVGGNSTKFEKICLETPQVKNIVNALVNLGYVLYDWNDKYCGICTQEQYPEIQQQIKQEQAQDEQDEQLANNIDNKQPFTFLVENNMKPVGDTYPIKSCVHDDYVTQIRNIMPLPTMSDDNIDAWRYINNPFEYIDSTWYGYICQPLIPYSYYAKNTNFYYVIFVGTELSYKGYPYYLPVDKKGKAKRVKGKNITVTDYETVVVNLKENEIHLVIAKNFQVQ